MTPVKSGVKVWSYAIQRCANSRQSLVEKWRVTPFLWRHSMQNRRSPEGQLAFLANPKYEDHLYTTGAKS
jgi:hypothetical protein